MSLPNVFDPPATAELLARMDRLVPDTPSRWGQMNVAQMLAHCCIPYEQAQGERDTGASGLLKFLARWLVKPKIAGEALYGKNLRSPRSMSITDVRDFSTERERLRAYVTRAHGQGAAAFEGRAHVFFGPMTAQEWSNLLWKHLDHHFRQFGV
jgi:hypothetical protein